MTRIDAKQLLSTLSVLLAPDGGIRSSEEVPRLSKLMQKFSKKLVSKCIYIHILRSSSPELLEHFLAMNGWELLNTWFNDAMKNADYYLCGELVKLFALCPMTEARLQDNSDKNQAYKHIRQLSCDPKIEAEIRNLSLQIIPKWMSIKRTSVPRRSTAPPSSVPRVQSPLELHPILDVDDDYSEDYVPPTKSKSKPKPVKLPEKQNSVTKLATRKTSKSRLILDSESESDEEAGAPRGKIARIESVSSASEENCKEESPKQKSLSSQDIRNKLDEKSDVDDLLATDSSEDERAKRKVEAVPKPVQKPKTEKLKMVEKPKLVETSRITEKPKILDLTAKPQKLTERDHEIRRRRELARQKERERREQRAKPYSRTELRKELESGEKDKIKMIAQQLKEQNKGKSMTAGLGRIPRLPKKEPVEPVQNGTSFDSILGAMDSKSKMLKAPLVKNKNKDLLETLAGTGGDKPKSKQELERERELHQKRRAEEEAILEKRMEEERLEKEMEKKKEEEQLEKEEHEREEREKQERREKEEKELKEKEEKREREERRERKEARRKEQKQKEKDEKRKLEKEKKDNGKSNKKTEKGENKEKKDKEKDRLTERRDSSSSESGRSDKPTEKKDKPKSDTKFGSSERTDKDKRRLEEPPKVKKPSVIKESNMFGDMLSSIMKDDKPKVKKRRPSDIKAEKDAKEFAKQKEKEREKEKERAKEREERLSGGRENSSSPTQVPDPSDRQVSVENSGDDDLPFSEPKSREVKGILIFARGFKSKKKLKWRPDTVLVQVEYFELDETERANVFKEKTSFADKRKFELEMEKNKLKSGTAEEDEKAWNLTPLDYDHPVEYGNQSQELDLQRDRESKVLRPLYFDNKLPSDPTEPDPSPKSEAKPKAIPQIDLNVGTAEESTTDFSADPWPALSTVRPAPAFTPALAPATTKASDNKSMAGKLQDIFSLLKPGLLENIVNLTSSFPNTSLPPPSLLPHCLSPPTLLPPSLPPPNLLPLSLPPPTLLSPTTVPVGRAPGQEPLHDVNKDGRDDYRQGPPADWEDGYTDQGPNGYSNYPDRRYFNKPKHSRGRPNGRFNARNGPPYNNRPCRYFMDTGNCNMGDHCLFTHVQTYKQH